jgi:hypothetical protein
LSRYNSTIFSSIYATDFLVAAVTEDFINNGYWNQTAAQQEYVEWGSNGINSTKNYTGEVQNMQRNVQNLSRLDPTTCHSTYGKMAIKSPYRNALLVISVTQNNTWLGGMLAFPETEVGHLLSFEDWMYGVSFFGPSLCPASSWDGVNKSMPVILANYTKSIDGFDCEVYNAPLQYCLAESADEFSLDCTVSANTKFLFVVLVCNVVKFICLVATITAWTFRPLAVVGDAIASFMARPDPTTDGLGPLSCRTASMFSLRKMSFRQKFEKLGASGRRWNGTYTIRWRDKAYRWKHSVSSLPSLIALVL